MTTTTIQDLASEVSKAFIGDKRTDGTEFRKLRDGSPEWMTDLCHHAHGDMGPDDYRYEFIENAIDALAENDDPDEICLEPDIYTSELTGWLNSRADRYAYCDEAMEEYGSDFKDTLSLLQLGQLQEKNEVLNLVRQFLEERAAELEADDDDALPTEPEECDLVTTDYLSFYEFGMSGKAVVTSPDVDAWPKAVRAYQDKQQFWGNVWYQGERGDYDLLDLVTGRFAQ